MPVGGSLTQYQLLEGMLVGSANNYADRLAGNLWPTDAVFANAANSWLSAHGVPGVTVVEPTGLDPRNTASPEALIALAQKAMAEPVIAEIVAKPAVELPGAGLVDEHQRPARRPRSGRHQDRLPRLVQPALREGRPRRRDDRAPLQRRARAAR